MRVRIEKAASGIAIRNAFEITMLEMLGNDVYWNTHENLVGDTLIDFSERDRKTSEPFVGTARGLSVRVSNAEQKKARFCFQPVVDEKLYRQFEVRVLGIEVDLGYRDPKNVEPDFMDELRTLATKMQQRIALWLKDKPQRAA